MRPQRRRAVRTSAEAQKTIATAASPVLCVIPYREPADALAIANDSDYGLVAGVFGNDLDTALWLADRLEAGQVFVNEWFLLGQEAPFGGFEQSGFGREKGQEAVRSYNQPENGGIRRASG